jgi:hypothetical protein
MSQTKNQEFTNSVNIGKFPDNTFVPLDDRFTDNRGEIQNLILSQITSIARITSKRGTVRANHYHLTDWHYSYVEAGEIYYFERSVGSGIIPEPKVIKAGMMFFTPPSMEHAMLFTKDTVFFTFAKNIRSHDSHESDLIRVPFINQEIADTFLLQTSKLETLTL